MRERLWSVVARRATAAMIRGSRRRAPGAWLVDSQGRLPEPRLEAQLATALADRLPGVVVAGLGVRGLLALAAALAWPLRVAGRLGGVGRPGAGS